MWIDLKQAVVGHSWVYMDVQMRHLLKRCLADGMPHTQPLVGESCGNGASDSCNRRHNRRARGVVKLTNVTKMLPGNDEGVTGMKLPKVNNRYREIIFPDDTSRLRSTHDPAEDASVTHEPVLANLTVKLRGRPEAPDERRGRTISSRARGA